MARKNIALLLILFIGLSPVMSAFADCLESSHSKSGRATSASVTADDPAMMLVVDREQETDGHGDHGNVSCHTGSTCVFHLCGGLGLTGAIRFTPSLLSNQHSLSFRANLNGRAFVPELEPPIRIL